MVAKGAKKPAAKKPAAKKAAVKKPAASKKPAAAAVKPVEEQVGQLAVAVELVVDTAAVGCSIHVFWALLFCILSCVCSFSTQ